MTSQQQFADIAAEHSRHLNLIEILDDSKAKELNIRGRYDPTRNAVITRKPDTAGRLWLFLHECGHSKLHTPQQLTEVPVYHVGEVEAEHFVFKAMKKAKVEVPIEIIQGSVCHIIAEAVADICAGFKLSQLVLAYARLTGQEEILSLIALAQECPRTTAFLAHWYDAVNHPVLQENPRPTGIKDERHIKLYGYLKSLGRFQEVIG
jgi:hypothetical protein